MTIITHIYEEEKLIGIGPIMLATNYMAFTFTFIFAPACPWKYKTQLLVGAIFYTINYSSGLIVPFIENHTLKYLIAALGAGIAGASGAPMWVSMGGYLHLVC
jgi:hypothetical protein